MKSNFLGSIFGLLVTDALGLPVEFRSRPYLEENPVMSMIGYGTHNQPPGTWSDDSSTMLCTLESMIGEYDPSDVADKMVRWYAEGVWSPYGEVFDIGNTTRVALELLRRGVVKADRSGLDRVDSNGNGALPRMIPLAWLLVDSPIESVVERTAEISRITHAHKRALVAAATYTVMAIHLIHRRAPADAYARTCADICGHFGDEPELSHYTRLLGGGLGSVGEEQIESTGYCVHGLETVIWSLLQTGSFGEAVLLAANLGGDTDTNAALTGGLAGIFYGVEAVPKDWIEVLVKKKEIMKLVLRFYRHLRYAGNLS